jgi:hypothetical protein
MHHRLRLVSAVLILGFAMLACASSITILEETPVPTSDVSLPTPEQPDSATQPSTTPTPDALLPQPLYFLAFDGQSVKQVFRLERDGKAEKQLTFESANVTNYDVSPVDGSIAFESDNQLLLANADGSNRRVMVDGARKPVFSPDGKTLAYSLNGLNLYDLSTGNSNLVLPDQPLGGSLPPELYIPDKYSPDGTKLLLEVGHPPDSPWTAAIYTPATNTVVPVAGNDPRLSCCVYYGGANWSADSSSLYTAATIPDASTPFGELWKVDANTGAAATLIPGSAGDGNMMLMYLAYEPYLAPDGGLNFFSAKIPEATGHVDHVPMVIVRTRPEDITANWSILRGDMFDLVDEVLWAPDASIAIVVFAPLEAQIDGGRAEVVYFDGRPNAPLADYAENLKWGR